MARVWTPITAAFNRGVVSALGLGRIDLARIRGAAETMVNWMPRVLGSMMLRPGWEYLGSTRIGDAARYIPFVYASDDTALIELTNARMRVWIGDALVTRDSVTATVTNGTFATDITGWTDSSETGASLSWSSGPYSDGYLSLLGTGTNSAIAEQTVSVGASDHNTEHALSVVIQRGPVTFRVGSTSGDDDLIAETELETGHHSLAFTPGGANFYVKISSVLDYTVQVDSVTVESAGAMVVNAYSSLLDDIRYDQSADVIFVADGTKNASGIRYVQQYKIERRGDHSWSVVTYEPQDGPFNVINTSKITIASTATSGDVTLTASKAIFRSSHVGALFKLSSQGQYAPVTVTAADTFSDYIEVAGSGSDRAFTVNITGTFTATVTIQYSAGAPGTWVDSDTYTTATTTSKTDGFDNQTVYWRIGVKTGDFTSGTVNASISFAVGSITGIARITAYSSGTSVSAVVLKHLGNTSATPDWYEGAWSGYRGYVSAVAIHEGRIWWAGNDKVWGSVSGTYESFDDEVVGDSGPIARSVGEGPVDSVHWLLSIGRLMLGNALNSANVDVATIDGNSMVSARSSSLDEPLTPTNFNLKGTSRRGIFVDRSKQRLYELAYSIQTNDYQSNDLSVLTPDYNSVGIVRVAVQMKPDIRIHAVRSDGTVGVLVFDPAENVTCWCEMQTSGSVEDVVVLPGTEEDAVYYQTKRTINSAQVRYLEKWAKESECIGGTANKQADAFYHYSGSSTTTITASHLAAATCSVWADGKDVGPLTADASGVFTLSTAASEVIIGLPYTAQWKSGKAAFGQDVGTPLNQQGIIDAIGFSLLNTHYQGLTYGPDFSNLDPLPQREAAQTTAADTVWSTLDTDMMRFPGSYSTDPRVCLQAASPRPCNVVACTVSAKRAEG